MKTLIGKLGRTLALAGAFVASTAFGGVAKIGETPYDSLKAAIVAAQANQTIVVTEDHTIPYGEIGSPTISKSITIDFDGHKVGAVSGDDQYQKGVFTIKGEGITVTFKNSSTTDGGMSTEYVRAVEVLQGTMILESGYLGSTGGGAAGVISVRNGALCKLNGGRVYVTKDSTAASPKIIYADGGKVELNGTEIVSASTTKRYDGIFCDGTGNDVKVTDGSISLKCTQSRAVAVESGDTANIVISGGKMSVDGELSKVIAIGDQATTLDVTGGTFELETTGTQVKHSVIEVPQGAKVNIADVTVKAANPEKARLFYNDNLSPEDVKVESGSFEVSVPEAVVTGMMFTDEQGKMQVKQIGALVTHADGTTAEFETLAQAVAAAQDGDTIKLGQDFVGADNKGIEGMAFAAAETVKTVTLDLNGHTVKAKQGYILFSLGANNHLVVDDTSAGKAGLLTNVNAGPYGVINLRGSNAEVELRAGTIQAGAGGSQHVITAKEEEMEDVPSENVSVVVKGGKLIGANNSEAAAVIDIASAFNSKIVVEGGEVTDPTGNKAAFNDANATANTNTIEIKGDAKVSAGRVLGSAAKAETTIAGGDVTAAVKIAEETQKVTVTGGAFNQPIPQTFIGEDFKSEQGADGKYRPKSVFSAVIGDEIAEIDFDTRDPEARLVALDADDVFQYTLDGWKEAGAGSTAEVTLKLNGVDAETHLTSNEDGTLAWKADRRGMYLFTYKSGDYTQDARFYVTDLINQIGDAGEVTATYDEEGNVIALNVKLLSDITKQLVINEPVDVNFNMNGKNIMIAESASDDPNGKVAVVLAQGTTNKVNFMGNGTVKGGDAYEAASDATGGYAVAYVDADGKYQTDKTGERGTKEAGVTFVDGAQGVQLKLLAVKQRYPWNGLVDMKYSLSRDLKGMKSYRLTITVTPKEGDAIVISKDAIVHEPVYTAGEHVFTWNALMDMPGLVLKGAKVKLDLEIHD